MNSLQVTAVLALAVLALALPAHVQADLMHAFALGQRPRQVVRAVRGDRDGAHPARTLSQGLGELPPDDRGVVLGSELLTRAETTRWLFRSGPRQFDLDSERGQDSVGRVAR